MSADEASNAGVRNLTEAERRAIIHDLLACSDHGEIPFGALTRVAKEHGRAKSTVKRAWDQYMSSVAEGVVGGDCSPQMKGRVGAKRKDRDEILQMIRAVPMADRQTKTRLAAAVGISRCLLTDIMDDGDVRRVTDRIHPTLTDANKLARLKFVLAQMDEATLEYDGGFDVVHIDEKWFNEDKDNRSYLLLKDEEPPMRTRKSKRFIPKTMFLAAVARPRYDPHRKTVFDGKIGLWPLIETYVALRDSVHRKKGTVCTRNVATVDRALYKHYIIDHVIPAIKTKWPAKDCGRVIFIQQDNAKPHVPPTDPDVIAAGTAGGWNIRMLFQPPNSPDLNVLDLGFFAAIQSIQYREQVRGIDNLVAVVEAAFLKTNVETLENVFLSAQAVMTCILESDGGNGYKLPHIGKAAMRNKGELPTALCCDRTTFNKATAVLLAAGEAMLF